MPKYKVQMIAKKSFIAEIVVEAASGMQAIILAEECAWNDEIWKCNSGIQDVKVLGASPVRP